MTEPPVPPDETGPDAVLRSSDHGAVRTLVLNRPSSFNAFDLALKGALLTALGEAAEDQDVRCLVITGAGRAFCAGQDLREHLALVEAGDPRVASTVTDFYNVLVQRITGMGKPVVAAVNGAAAGAGAGLAFACDLRIAAASASFSMAFAAVGLSADTGASFTLPRLIGAGRASAMMLTGERVEAAEALRIGMVDEVVPVDAFEARVAELGARLAAGPTVAYSQIKASLHAAAASGLPEALAFEARAQETCFASPDHREAIEAFVHKRPPHFLGR